jgi:hypothetical protein
MSDIPRHRCIYSPSPRGKYLLCSVCKERFPCAEETCGHLDCHEERGVKPRCHLCRKLCDGANGMTTTPKAGEPEPIWTSRAIRGITRAVHYDCLDAQKEE